MRLQGVSAFQKLPGGHPQIQQAEVGPWLCGHFGHRVALRRLMQGRLLEHRRQGPECSAPPAPPCPPSSQPWAVT